MTKGWIRGSPKFILGLSVFFSVTDFPFKITTDNFAFIMPARRILFPYLIIFCLSMTVIRAQDTSYPVKANATDSLSAPDLKMSGQPDTPVLLNPDLGRFTCRYSPNKVYGQAVDAYMSENKSFNISARPVEMGKDLRKRSNTDWLFYLFILCFTYLGIIRLSFSRYLEDLFSVFFNVVLRQKHLRDQLAQKSIPSLLLNIFFVVSGGLFLSLITRGLPFAGEHQPWLISLLFVLLLTLIYLSKYLIVLFTGWITGKGDLAGNYIFIVFMINKMLGILLLPMSVLLAFTDSRNRQLIITLSLILLSVLMMIRLVRAYNFMHKELRINILHFLVFVFSFEVLPILLLDKAIREFLMQ